MFHFLIAVVPTGKDTYHSHKPKMGPFLDVEIFSKIVILINIVSISTFIYGVPLVSWQYARLNYIQ